MHWKIGLLDESWVVQIIYVCGQNVSGDPLLAGDKEFIFVDIIVMKLKL